LVANKVLGGIDVPLLTCCTGVRLTEIWFPVHFCV
jgi:hypothetical protein